LFLREFTHGHVRQLQSAGRQVLVNLAGRTPLPPSADVLTFRSRISQNENSRSTQFGRWIEAEWAWVYLQDFRTEGGLQ